MVSIYALVHPRTGRVRYIGRTKNPTWRLYYHVANCQGTKAKRRWIAGLKARGLRPKMRILERCAWVISDAREWRWISELRERGAALFNRGSYGMHFHVMCVEWKISRQARAALTRMRSAPAVEGMNRPARGVVRALRAAGLADAP